MLPDVGSTIVPPGISRPSRSAASISATATRSLIEPPGLNDSSLATRRGRSAGADARQAHERRVADRVEDRVLQNRFGGDLGHAHRMTILRQSDKNPKILRLIEHDQIFFGLSAESSRRTE